LVFTKIKCLKASEVSNLRRDVCELVVGKIKLLKASEVSYFRRNVCELERKSFSSNVKVPISEGMDESWLCVTLIWLTNGDNVVVGNVVSLLCTAINFSAVPPFISSSHQ